jgi:transcriptional regulator with XRE-family HTH domain
MILLEPKRLGRVIRERRQQLRYTQHKVADAAGVGRQWLVELEAGKARSPLDLVMRVLGVLDLVLQIVDLPRGAPLLQPASLEARASQRGGDGGMHGAGLTTSQRVVPARRAGQEEQEAEGAKFLGRDYAIADFGAAKIAVDQGRLYWSNYREVLRSMVALVVDREAPVFEDVLERRIASAHGQRVTNKLKHVIAELTKSLRSTPEGDRKVFWSSDADAMALPKFRSDPQSLRDHGDIPLVELASLAASFLSGRTPDQVIMLMSKHLGLSSVRSATRARLLRAVERASQCAEAVTL